ncbi:CotH kinase family protein [Candidatus Pelagibacter sp.]|nr:CotH kinase family protein [Candidatus Pelagibacter sp.]
MFLKKIFFKIIFIFGSLSFISALFLVFYYFNSGTYHSFKPLSLLKKIDQVIVNKHLGFSFFKIDDYIKNEIKSLKFLIFDNDLENVVIKIDQKNLYNLELQRKNKILNLNRNTDQFSKAEINYNEKDFRIKLRVKGDRSLHWYKGNETSYKIDLIGKDRIWGLEEFSVQKPITRNYIYEYIFHKFLEFNNLISLKYFFINLKMNDIDQGIYAVEEGFSKELIERNKKRNGQIFGLEEKLGKVYPNVVYDLYSKDFWISNYPDLTNIALEKLENIKTNNVDLGKFFDLEKWALYFAIIDLTQNYHGSLPKSVKLYYNPTTALFEPIGFDGHYNPMIFNEFLLLDFLDKDNNNCDWICRQRVWYLKFLKNDEFYSLYKDMLKKISKKTFIENFLKLNSEKINYYNYQFLSESSKSDKMFRKGLGPYLYDEKYLENRAKYVRFRLDQLNKNQNTNKSSNHIFLKKKNILENDKIKKIGNVYFLSQNLDVTNSFFLPRGKILEITKGVKINFVDDYIISSYGSIIFNGTKNKPILVSSKNKVGSLVLNNGDYKLKNVIFKNLSHPKEKDKILYGGINIINSNIEIENVKIISSNSEDAINLIDSKSIVNNLEILDSFADGIDVDFGSLSFNNIICKNIANDCFDISSAIINGKNLKGNVIKDKGLSFGENSVGNINNIDFQNSRLGIAVKDGSNLTIEGYTLKDNEYDIAVFNKKNEYEGAKLELTNSNKKNKHNLNYLLGNQNTFLKDNIFLDNKIDNDIINKIFY